MEARKGIAGSYLIEILTQGMYANPYNIYREYVQNCGDSIKIARTQGLLKSDEGTVFIKLDSANNAISITDDGTGIPSADVERILLSIGASDKNKISSDTEGFRGIGRLAGITYADKLYFKTSAYGENCRSIVSINCIKFREIIDKLRNDKLPDDIRDVMDIMYAISEIMTEPEEPDKHYFEVYLENASKKHGLFDMHDVAEYLCQIVPVDFDYGRFINGKKIQKFLKEKMILLPTYKIIFDNGNSFPQKLTKPYCDRFRSDTSESISGGKAGQDSIRDIEFIYETAPDGSPLYAGWLAVTTFVGMVNNPVIRGIRLRRGNILVGNANTFNQFFTEEAANRTFIGEIYVLHKDIILNSQRDDFEKNKMYFVMEESLRGWAKKLNDVYRRGTSEANSAIKKLALASSNIKAIESKLKKGELTKEEAGEELAKNSDIQEKAKKKLQGMCEKSKVHPDIAETIEKVLNGSGEYDDETNESIKRLNEKVRNADETIKSFGELPLKREAQKYLDKAARVINEKFEQEIATELIAALREEFAK